MDEQEHKSEISKPVEQAVAKFRDEFAYKSYADRHPELGRMLNCPVCNRRHRDVVKCQERVLVPTAQTRKGVYGAAQFAKKRIRPHHSAALLQLVQLTQQLFSNYYPRIAEPEQAMRAARGEALQTLRRQRRTVRSIRNAQQQESRRINRNK